MRTLAIETTDPIGSVAAFDAGRLLAAHDLSPDRRAASSLAPGIRALLDEVGWRPDQVELVAVPTGPGSFTGLRVGVTAAKTFAYATGAAVLGVNTLAVLATQAGAPAPRLHVASDAQRQEVFAALFCTTGDGPPATLSPTQIMPRQAWLEQLAAGDTVTGPVLTRCAADLPPGVLVTDAARWRPTATTVGQLAVAQFNAGQRDDLWNLLPNYYRQSAAEEAWTARNPSQRSKRRS